MGLPREEWLREDFSDYSNRDAVSNLPISEFLHETGYITKRIYKEAVERYIQTHKDEIEWVQERCKPCWVQTGFHRCLDKRWCFQLCAIDTLLRNTARESGLIIKERKIDPVILFWMLTLGFGTTFTSARDAIQMSNERG